MFSLLWGPSILPEEASLQVHVKLSVRLFLSSGFEPHPPSKAS